MSEATPARPPWGARIVLVLFSAVVVPGVATVLHHYPPSEYNIYLPCMFHLLTGLHCPGCGMTRCVGALVHGDIAQAFAWNPLFVLLLPVILFGSARIVWTTWTGAKLRPLAIPRWPWLVFIAIVVAFAIARNIDLYPLNLLAPHRL